jgi:hypothetical protein
MGVSVTNPVEAPRPDSHSRAHLPRCICATARVAVGYAVVVVMSLASFVALSSQSIHPQTGVEWWALIHLGVVLSLTLACLMSFAVVAPVMFMASRPGRFTDGKLTLHKSKRLTLAPPWWVFLIPGGALISVYLMLELGALYSHQYWYAVLAALISSVALVVVPTTLLLIGIRSESMLARLPRIARHRTPTPFVASMIAWYWARQMQTLEEECRRFSMPDP